MHDIRLLDLPIDVLARVGPLIRDTDMVFARTVQLLSDRTEYLVVAVEPGAVTAITVTRSTYGDVQREVERVEGPATSAFLHRLGLLEEELGTAGTTPTETCGSLSN